jgi:hypothetical protein
MALHIATDSALIPGDWHLLLKHHLYHNISDYPKSINNFIKTNAQQYRFKEV